VGDDCTGEEQQEADRGRGPDDGDSEEPEKEAGGAKGLQRGQHGEPGIGEVDLAQVVDQEFRPGKSGKRDGAVRCDGEGGDDDVGDGVLAFLSGRGILAPVPMTT
jgi:hypothetical protein